MYENYYKIKQYQKQIDRIKQNDVDDACKEIKIESISRNIISLKDKLITI